MANYPEQFPMSSSSHMPPEHTRSYWFLELLSQYSKITKNAATDYLSSDTTYYTTRSVMLRPSKCNLSALGIDSFDGQSMCHIPVSVNGIKVFDYELEGWAMDSGLGSGYRCVNMRIVVSDPKRFMEFYHQFAPAFFYKTKECTIYNHSSYSEVDLRVIEDKVTGNALMPDAGWVSPEPELKPEPPPPSAGIPKKRRRGITL